MTEKEREELAEAIGKGLASGSKISAEDLQNENTISYKMGEIMEMDADFVTLLNFVDWYSPTKEVNEKLTKMLRHIAGQTYQNQTKIVELEAQIEKMKCCGNCIHCKYDENEESYEFCEKHQQVVNVAIVPCSEWKGR